MYRFVVVLSLHGHLFEPREHFLVPLQRKSKLTRSNIYIKLFHLRYLHRKRATQSAAPFLCRARCLSRGINEAGPLAHMILNDLIMRVNGCRFNYYYYDYDYIMHYDLNDCIMN